MPEKEFEIYLKVLGKLLRLNPSQKSAIADEFRDHLDERLADLMQSGLSRDEAIQAAIDEFGDVTGLALDLTRASRPGLRKVVVRSTVAVTAVAAVFVGWLLLFAPEQHVVAPPVVQAQPPKRVEKEPAKDKVASSFLDDEELFPAFLAQTIDVDFQDTPLNEVCDFLADQSNVPVLVHKTALADEGIDADALVNLHLKGLTVEEILNHVTQSLHLSWQVDGGLIQITTPSTLRAMTRHIDLHSLTRKGHSIETIVRIIRMAGTGWEEEGEAGTTAVIGDAVVLRQTYPQQRRIAQVLAALGQDQPQQYLETCTDRERLLAALQQPGSVEFVDMPLLEATSFLSDQYQVAILLDLPALSDEGISSDQQITLTLKDKPLAKLFDYMLRDLGLTYQIRNGVFRITTRSKAEEDLIWIVYNLNDLAASPETLSQLSTAILTATSGKWIQIDGEGGELTQTNVGGYLLVKQTDQVQFEIQKLIEQVRRSRKDHLGDPEKTPVKSRLITRMYSMSKEVASDLQTSLPNLVAPTSWKGAGDELPLIELIASTPFMDHVNGTVSGGNHEIRMINAPAEAPRTEGKGAHPGAPPGALPAPATTVQSIVVRPRSVLVIRQSPEVHREIQNFLRSLNVVFDLGSTDGIGGVPRGGGGMGGGGMGGMGGGFF